MALIFTEGFDAYGTTEDSAPVPTDAHYRRGWSSGSSPKVQAGRINGYSMSYGFSSNISRSGFGSQTTKTVGVALYLENALPFGSTILALYDSTTIQVKVALDASGHLVFYRGSTVLATSTEMVSTAAWNYIELKTTINNTTDAYDLRLNGTSVLSATSLDTQVSANTYWDRLYLSAGGGWDYIYADDLYVTDSTGTDNTGFLGTIHIETLFPNADVTTDWTTSTGTDHYALVDENPADDDTTYVEDNVSTDRELFDFPALTAASDTIFGVTSIVDARVTDASSVDMKFVNKSSTTVTTGSAQTVSSTSQARFEEITEQDPNTSSAWTKTTFEAAQFGFEVA